ncbi:uncharacterized protein Z520_08316 [Fonsecaea multimorphosa CBS 102226]|uniref:GH16 domain-containing protein n=1 Tax=Fonsecaea multimorphosa CBS 102226 TaxID=1442371 RepID=A0A0D2IG77_9EURO|nr:uncharacterized protein Z520_08316 [Fonsecaea multimorphosa CBS 102226]KIX96061.1 hypothetical protein Z520_08316 [Fonsecaea multimorphosa CBS 102226]OAL21827.1 hypothetical protein AYO22_07769 [Fonsecaea multimorphosa]
MPSSSLFLRSSTTLVSALLLLSSSASADTYYALDTEYSGKDFFDGFNFFADADPTHGFVTYVDEATAEADGLITFNGGSTQMRVDYKNTYNGSADYYNINNVGRPSVRIESIKSWTHGLFLADLKHMPTTNDGTGCGVWPAFWTLGSGTWPYNGEIDIIEGANNQATDLTSTHVAGTCIVSQSPSEMTGTTNGDNCTYDVNTGANAQGCGAFDPDSDSYGSGFNSIKGGVYAMEWTSEAIKIWFFPRSSIPSDISSGSPDPSGWGLPASIFDGPGCDIDSNFADNRIVFDTTFCGDFGDATWSSGGCAASTGESQCSIWVGNNPGQFKDAYWDVNSVKIYQSQPVTTTSTTTTTTTLATSTRPPQTTTSPVVPTTTPYVPHTTPSSTTSRSLTVGPFYNTSSSSSLKTWDDWTATTTTDPFTGTWGDWTDGKTSSVSSSTPSSSKTSSFLWQDWTTSATKPTDPATTWGDWSGSDSVVTVTITKTWTEPCSTGYTTKTTTITTTHCGCTETPVPTACMTTKTFTPSAGWPFSTPIVASVPCAAPAAATSTAPKPSGTWAAGGQSGSGKPVSPVAAASTGTPSGAWATPSVTLATTLTVAPVAPSLPAWTVAAASTSPVTPVAAASIVPSNGTWGGAAATSTNSWVAPYKGAASRTTSLNGLLAVLAAGAAALGMFAM